MSLCTDSQLQQQEKTAFEKKLRTDQMGECFRRFCLLPEHVTILPPVLSRDKGTQAGGVRTRLTDGPAWPTCISKAGMHI
jgi:hypothetical protein